MFNCKFYTILLCCYFLTDVSEVFGKYAIQNFSPAIYKAGNQNIDFAQNRDMTLFVANNLGVLSYNGNDWVSKVSQTGKKQRSVAFDELTNRLYVGLQGEFGYFEDEWNYVSLLEKIPEDYRDFDEVWDVFVANSVVYFCTFKGIFSFQDERISVYEYEPGLQRSFMVNGRLFSQTEDGQLLALESRNFVAAFPQKNTNDIIAGIIPHLEGYLIFYNSGEIEYTTAFQVSYKYNFLRQALSGKYVNHVLQLSDNRLAISTQTAGIFLVDLATNTIEQISTEDGLETNACLRTFQDYSGNLWVGTQSGISLININSPMRLIGPEIGIQGSGYDALETATGTYYSTSNGIYYLPKNKTKAQFVQGTEGPSYELQEYAGITYAGHHTGLFKLTDGKATKLASTDGLWNIKPLRSNSQYVIGGTYSGLHLFEFTDQFTLEHVGKIAGFDESSRFFEEDAQGNIWVGQYYKGLYKLSLSSNFREAEVSKIDGDEAHPINDQIILSKTNNNLFLSTNMGVYRLDAESQSVESAELFQKEIGTQPVYLFEEDKQKNIHVLLEDKVGFFKQISAKNYAFVPSSLYQLRYFLNNDLLNISSKTNDGVLFSANNGFIQYQPDLEVRAKVESPLLVSRVFSSTLDSTLYTKNPFHTAEQDLPQLKLSHKAEVLEFNVEAFQYANLNNLQFRYKLDGLNDEFGEWTTSPVKEYTNLREGKYSFQVEAKNYLGEVITSKPFQFAVKPPLQRTLFAKLLYAFLALLGLFLATRFQRGRYKRKAVLIEEQKKEAIQKKEARFNELELQWEAERKAEQVKLEEIERKKEKELLALKEEKMESELRHLNNLLAASTMNLVVKNEFIENIKSGLKEVKRKGQSIETKEAIDEIVKEIDTTLRVQEDWEQFEHHFDQVHGDFLSRLRETYPNLSPNEQKLCAFLRLNLNTKEIANVMNVSPRGVEIARYRLRKKLGLEKGDNLSKVILEY